MKKYILTLSLIALCYACKPTFKVEGNITDGEGMIYLEYVDLTKTTVLDSTKLSKSGHFVLKGTPPQYPDLYRIRLQDNVLYLTVDSTEMISVRATADSLALYATVEGSEDSKAIMLLRQSLQLNTVEAHKLLAQQLILQNPAALSSYYALFQYKDGKYVFDIFDHQDRRYFQSVATAFNLKQGKSTRSKTLYNQVLEVLTNERKAQNSAKIQQLIQDAENSFLEIKLPDNHGKERALSECKGKYTLLDFSATTMRNSNDYYMQLRELYNKYNQKAFAIFSVSADKNKLLWEQAVEALPWITVREESDMAFQLYNIVHIPTLYLLDKDGIVIERIEKFEDLDKKLSTLL